jgi:hypothetical protein
MQKMKKKKKGGKQKDPQEALRLKVQGFDILGGPK